MRIVKLHQDMLPLTYLIRHWGKYYYVDVNGFWNPCKDVIVKLKNIKEEQ